MPVRLRVSLHCCHSCCWGQQSTACRLAWSSAVWLEASFTHFNEVSVVVQGKNAFLLMPTGGGKSLCYQVRCWPATIGNHTMDSTAQAATHALIATDDIACLQDRSLLKSGKQAHDAHALHAPYKLPDAMTSMLYHIALICTLLGCLQAVLTQWCLLAAASCGPARPGCSCVPTGVPHAGSGAMPALRPQIIAVKKQLT